MVLLNIFRIRLPKGTMQQLEKHEGKNVMLHKYDMSTIMQLGVFRVMVRYKSKLWGFFEVPRGGPALLGKPDIEILGILSISNSTAHPRRCTRQVRRERR